MENTHCLRRLKNRLAVALIVAAVACLPNAVLAKMTGLAIVPTTDGVIDFGSFSVLPSCANCFITISPAGARTASAGIVLTSANPGRAASFTVTPTCNGGGCAVYTAAVTPNSASLPAGGVTMTVGTFTLQQSATLPPNVLTVGATLTIPSSASAGSYAGAAFIVTTSPF
jgi:hypothetical protein